MGLRLLLQPAWLRFVVLAAFAAAATSFSSDRLYFLVVGILWAIVIPISVLRSRRTQRNVTLPAGASN
jgi:hypothetical protein